MGRSIYASASAGPGADAGRVAGPEPDAAGTCGLRSGSRLLHGRPLLPRDGVAGAQQQGQQHEVGHDGTASVAHEGQRDAGERDELDDAPQDEEGLQAEDAGEAGRQETGEVVPCPSRDAETTAQEDEVEEDDADGSYQPQLLPDGGEDEVGLQSRDDRVARLQDQVPLAQTAPQDAPGGQCKERLHDLIAAAGRVLPGIEPDVHPGLHVGEDVVKQRRSGKEEGQAHQNVEGAPRGHVQDRQERPEEQQAGAQVLHEDHQDHGQAPDGEQGGQIAEGRQGDAQHPPRAHREHLPDVDQIGGEEDHQEDLAELGRLEAYRPQDDPQTGAVDLPPQAGGQQEQEDTGDADQVAVLAQPLQPAHEHQGEEERRQTHDQPDGLLACELLVEAEDHQDAQGRQQSRDGQEIGIRVGDQHSPARHGRWRRAPRTPRRRGATTR